MSTMIVTPMSRCLARLFTRFTPLYRAQSARRPQHVFEAERAPEGKDRIARCGAHRFCRLLA